jgi:hypothetical protein
MQPKGKRVAVRAAAIALSSASEWRMVVRLNWLLRWSNWAARARKSVERRMSANMFNAQNRREIDAWSRRLAIGIHLISSCARTVLGE